MAATEQADQAGVPWLRRMVTPSPPRPVPKMTYDFPLREDMMIRLTLPVELTREDAGRITRFVETLAFTDEQLPPGGE